MAELKRVKAEIVAAKENHESEVKVTLLNQEREFYLKELAAASFHEAAQQSKEVLSPSP